MKARKLYLASVILIIVLLIFTPCTSAKVTNAGYGSTSASSGLYVWCAAMSEVINKALPDYNLTVVETGASIENLQLVKRGDLKFALATQDSIARSYNGEGEFKGSANPDLRVMWSFLELIHNIVVLKDSGVKSLYDLEGKRFGCGMTGSATSVLTLSLFDALNIKPKWFYGGTGANRDATKNRQIVGYVKSGTPDPSVMDVAASVPIRLLPVNDDDYAKVVAKYPKMFMRAYLPADLYGKGLPPEPVPSFSFFVMDFCTKDIPVDVVYRMGKAIYEAKDKLGEAYKPSKDIIKAFPKSTVETATIPLHSGIIKLCKELKIEVPADLIPPEYKD